VRGRSVVLLDDVASTGRTFIEAARGARAQGAASVDVAVTHALLVGDALDQLKAAGVRRIWSTDCVPHPSNAVSIVPLLAQALSSVMAGPP
jgi:ribose-phosphate pyrophosphokinase